MSAVATWVGALATLVLAVVAVFQDRIRAWMTRPRLSLEARVVPPDCHKTTWNYTTVTLNWDGRAVEVRKQAPCYYFRLRVLNKGNAEAREVEVYASALERKREDRKYAPVERFTPMNLMWAHFRSPFLPVLCPKMPKMCDLAHVIHPQHRKELGHDLSAVTDAQAILAFDLQVEPNMRGHLVEPGTYRLSLVVGAANVAPRECTLEIEFPGTWIDEEADMLGKGFKMRLV